MADDRQDSLAAHVKTGGPSVEPSLQEQRLSIAGSAGHLGVSCSDSQVIVVFKVPPTLGAA